MWISNEELMTLPTTGAAWEAVQKAANSSWGSANLSDNDSPHDILTLAGAYVAVRTNDSALHTKVEQALESAIKSPLARALEAGRGLAAYIIAADVLGYRTVAFENWIIKTIEAPIQGHSGGVGILGTAIHSATNWGGHCRASLAAAAIYTERNDYQNAVVTAQRAMIGVDAPGNALKFTDTGWHAGTPQAGINTMGAVKDGKNLSGVLPEDWRRGGNYKWPPTRSNYMWGGMNGLIVTAVLLHRAGWLSLTAGDNALFRALDILYGQGLAANNSPKFVYPATGDDTWITWVANAYSGNYPTTPASSGKGMGWTDWTHGKAAVVDPPVDPPVEKFPMDVIASKNWKLTLPVGAPDEVKMPALAAYTSEWFQLNTAKDGVIFKAPTDGATTENSDNPRSELREMTDLGMSDAVWSTTAGTHNLAVELSIDTVPIGDKPVVVLAQIHGEDDDITAFRFEGNVTGDRSKGSLWITDGDTSHGHLITAVLSLGTRFSIGFDVADGIIGYTYNGQLVAYVLEKSAEGCYFKTGAYNQAGGIVTPLPDGKADYAAVTVYAVQVCHDGVCFGKAPSIEPPIDPPVDPPIGPHVIISGTEAAIAALKAFIKSKPASLKVYE